MKKRSAIFIIPKYQNRGIASKAIEKLFSIYPKTVVNDKMTLVDYVKTALEQ